MPAGDVEAMWRARDAQVPMGHMGDAWDVANAALFLASDESKYVTGHRTRRRWRHHGEELGVRRQLDAGTQTHAACGGCTASRGLWQPSRNGRSAEPQGAAPVRDECYCAIARMPPAKECHAAVVLIGQFSSFTATSAMPP